MNGKKYTIETNKKLMDVINDTKLEILDSGDAFINGDMHENAAAPQYSKLYFLKRSGGVIKWNGGEMMLQKGYMYLLPIGFSYESCFFPEMHHLFFHIRLSNSSGFDLLSNCTKCISIKISESKIDRLIEMYRSKNLIDTIFLKREIYYVLAQMLKTIDASVFENVIYSSLVKNTIMYVKKNLSMQLKIPEIASALYVSQSYLRNSFLKEMGMPLGAYIDAIIYSEAEKLLQTTDMTIKEISDRLGFADQGYFARKFHKYASESPGNYRLKKQKNIL